MDLITDTTFLIGFLRNQRHFREIKGLKLEVIA